MNPCNDPCPLEWIDEYTARLRDHVFVREADCLLIKVPNEAHKLNPSAVRLLKRLLDGESILELWDSYDRSPVVRKDLYHFFIGLKQVLQGCLNERNLPQAVVSRPFSHEFNTLPVLSEVAITYRCNLNCRFCYAGCSCTTGSGKGYEMTSEEALRVLRIIRHEAQVPSVSFTGGEPLLRRDLPDLIRYAREELGLRVNLITNGTLLDGTTARTLKQAGLNSAQVSLESPDGAVHDELTQVQGSHRRTAAAIRRLLDTDIVVHCNTTINRVNMGSVSAMPEFAKSLGLERLSMNLVIPCGSSGTAYQEVNLRYREIPELIVEIQAAARRNGMEFMWYSPTPACIFNPIEHRLGNKGCAACDGLLSVSPAGDVLPCSSWPEPVGNLFREEFEAIWNSVRARRLREKQFAAPICHDCEDFSLCQGGCPLYWRYFGCDELARFGGPHVAATG